MKSKVLLLSAMILMVISPTVRSQNNSHVADSLFAGNPEIYFTFNIFDRSEVDFLTRIISIDDVEDNVVFAYANRKEFVKFLESGYKYTVLPHPGSLLPESELNMGGKHLKSSAGTTWNFYPTYDQYVGFMQGFAADHPDICRLDTLGWSVMGRLLLAVKISDSVNFNRSKPEFLFTSTMHGDETTGYVLMLHLIDSLTTAYGTVPSITDLLNNYQIYINPLANPDGTYNGGNNTVNGAVRYNADGVDLNRNFPDPEAGPHPDGNPWEPETKAFMHYDSIHHFVMSANFHGGSEVLNYPWDTWSRQHADDTWFKFVCREYVDTVHKYSPLSYMSGFNNGITNGYAWYTITGGRQDYTTYFHYGREVTMEISNVKTLPSSQLITYWNYNRRSFLNYIRESGYGINGKVTDTVTNAPLKAKVFINGHDIDNSFEFSNQQTGWYYRPIAQGSWNLTFTCSGYRTKTLSGINVVNRSANVQNAELVPITYGVGEARINPITVFPNPSDGNIRLLLSEPTFGDLSYTIIDITGRTLASGNLVKIGESGLYRADLTKLSSGIYILRTYSGTESFNNKIEIK